MKEKLLEREKFIDIFNKVSNSYIKRMKNNFNDQDDIEAIRRKKEKDKIVKMIPKRKFEKLSLEKKYTKEYIPSIYPSTTKTEDKVIQNTFPQENLSFNRESKKHASSTFLTGTNIEEETNFQKRRVASSLIAASTKNIIKRKAKSKYHLQLDLKFNNIIKECDQLENQLKKQSKHLKSKRSFNGIGYDIDLRFKEDHEDESVKDTIKKMLIDEVGELIKNSNYRQKKINSHSEKEMKSKFVTTKLLEHPILEYSERTLKLDHLTHI